ncbi:MAG TPA: response regulator [Pyrinomonadaceae bacterium]|nr:response regulator [Pyrinomonadaceae bacterium]
MPPRSKKRILCAETHEDTCHMLTYFLERAGHEVNSAATIADCMRLASSASFDLYMVDDDYPDGTNIELCQQLRRLSPRTPIIFFSSLAYERDRQRGLAAGAQVYMTKPGDIVEIAATIEALLKRAEEDALRGEEHPS